MARPTLTEQVNLLTADLRVMGLRDEQRQRDLEQLVTAKDATQSELATLRQENALLRQKLDDHIKRLETWATRAWGLVPVLIGAVLSLAAGLVVTLARR